MTHLTITGTGV